MAAAVTVCVLLVACQREAPENWMETSTTRYEPARLQAAVERLGAWLAANNPAAASALQPGLDSAVVATRAQAENCRLPQEVIDFLRWHDGTRADRDVPLIWYHRFISLQDAFERRRTYGALPMKALSPLPGDWFPLFEFQGEFYFTRCQSDHPNALIWHWSGEEPELRLVFGSLTALLETAVDWYERGAVWVADAQTGALDMNIRQVHDIYVERNPGRTFPYHVPDA
jgi:hypothetical protein